MVQSTWMFIDRWLLRL